MAMHLMVYYVNSSNSHLNTMLRGNTRLTLLTIDQGDESAIGDLYIYFHIPIHRVHWEAKIMRSVQLHLLTIGLSAEMSRYGLSLFGRELISVIGQLNGEYAVRCKMKDGFNKFGLTKKDISDIIETTTRLYIADLEDE